MSDPATTPRMLSSSPPRWWRTLAEHARDTASEPPAEARTDEFPTGASIWPSDLSRRHFLETMAASLALAGLAGCGRPPPREKIVPYVTAPEGVVPGRPQFFATAMPWQGFARGILVESHLGRPTKIEGNPDHPDSLGATDAVTQAAILGLYDPDRSRVPLLQQQPSSWTSFENEWLALRRELTPAGSKGIAVLTEPTTSPTTLRLTHALLDGLPNARWYQHTALARFDRAGLQPDFDPAAADVILSIGADFLFEHPASLRYARRFAARRRIVGNERPPNRLYVVEPTPSITGTMADHRLPASPRRIAALLNALAAALEVDTAAAVAEQTTALDDEARQFVALLARDLREHAPAVACIAGPQMDESVHRWAVAINRRLGARSPVVRKRAAIRSDGDPRAAGDLSALARALADGEVHALLMLGANPAYTAQAGLDLGPLIERAPFSVHLGLHANETAQRCRWHLPESHFLETWADLRASDGAATLLQPLIEPLYATRSVHGVLQFLSEPPGRTDYDLVRDTWRERLGPADFESAWAEALRAGVLPHDVKPPAEEASDDAIPALDASGAEPVLLFRPDPWIGDGRWANNAWLQELPKPLSHLVWDNAAWISPVLAREHRLENGDIVTLESDGRTLDVAVWIQPGQAEHCLTLHFGYGRERAGTIGSRLGFNAFRLRSVPSSWSAPLTALRRTGRRYRLVSTQEHFAMERRDLVRLVAAHDLDRHEPASHEPAHAPVRLFPDWESTGYAWAMSIDLSTCIGCSACVAACQAENNTPVVGKDQVARGREMHWLRVDRYYSGNPAAPTMVHQPIPCMHCETAPCELVCPVAATVHSSEGLNDMVYNRCIGTRYCSNNCPYKVRRFNFLDYRAPADSPVVLQLNPNVTVRERGVMEKCTYCVQRINAGRIDASRENRRIRDGEVRTACQQACPAEAIVFGDLLTPGSAVSIRRSHELNYALLGELNTKPRTTYLARVVNSSPT